MTVNVSGIGSYFAQVKTRLNSKVYKYHALFDAYDQLKGIKFVISPARLLPTVYGLDENIVYIVWLQESMTT